MTRPRRARLVALAAAVAATVATTAGVQAAPQRARDLLPNLVALPTTVVLVGDAGETFVSPSGEVVQACDASDVAQRAARRCLRFDTIVANFGTGPLEVHTHVDTVAGERSVTQRVMRSDGTSYDVPAGTFELDPAHGHFHLAQFAVASLWRSTAGGVRVGRTPVRTGDKAGFCLEDVQHRGGNVAGAYTWPFACYPTVTEDGAVEQVQGISVGWSDIYDVAVAHQYVEVSGVADGYYLLQLTTDPGHRLRETTTKDNSVTQRIRICGDTVELVGLTSLCGR
jgi:hypothetical protein